MDIAVTGGAGFIGLNVVEKLIRDKHNVTIIDNNPERPKEFAKHSVGFANADIRKPAELEKSVGAGVDILIHLAAKSDARNMKDFILFKEINIDGTMNVLETARKKDIKNVIFASSSHVYGDKKERNFKESDTINPVSYYGGTKFMGEMFCRAYSDYYGINCTVLRLFTVYGPRGRTDMAVMNFIRSISTGQRLYVHGRGMIKKDFVYIDDVSDGVIKCLNLGRRFETINIGSGSATELSRIIALAEKELGEKAQIEFVPMQAGDVAYSCADITKAKKLLNWHPKTTIEAGIKKTAKWWGNSSIKI